MEIIPRILLYWYIAVFISTEILSYFHFINRVSIIIINLSFIILVLLFYNQKIKQLLRNLLSTKNISIYIILGILGLTFIQGVFSAPNTTDSMVYHLPKVLYWVQEKTLYQDVIRNDHDFMAPFAEYLLVHLFLIFNGDRMLFLSQWLAFTASIFLSYLIVKQLDAENRTAKLAALFVATLPIAVMQAASTQTDMITTVMVLFSIYFALIFRKFPNIENSLLLGFAIGLGLLTKATFVLYAIIPFALIISIFLKQNKRYILLGLIIIFIIGIVQARFIHQNLQLYGNISGQRVLAGESGYINELINPAVILSNLIRNIFLHIPIPIGTSIIQNGIVGIHNLIGLDLNDPRTTYFDTKFQVYPIIFPQEDIVGNPVHLGLIFLTGILLILKAKKIKNIDLKIYIYFLTIISFIIFSAVLKWQPFHSRLQTPFFILGSISAVSILYGYKRLINSLRFILIISVISAFIMIVLNTSRSFISYQYFYPYVKQFATPLSDIPEAFFIKSRDRQYFIARYYWYHPYTDIIKKLGEDEVRRSTVTFKLMDGFEYPLWLLLKKSDLNLRVIPFSKMSKDTVIISTFRNPYKMEGYKTECIKTEIEYGYACISVKNDKILDN